MYLSIPKRANEVSPVFKKIALLLLFLDLSVWIGSAVYFSFFAANEIFGGLPVDQAGAVIALLFPSYFGLLAGLSVVGWLLYWFFTRSTRAGNTSSRWGHASALIGAATMLVNRFILLPRIETITAQMGPISKASPTMVQKFGMMHGISMLLDLVGILAALGVWIVLAMNLRPTWGIKGDL
ncbi:DUF4149 domain-containing protein [Alicyclobacillus tolerans]|uniref:DUF4149 domain-containing protein n=1 Tax=Alicyclobacillus tolerans TaxID=90970 RepID=UPI001F46B12F|nr:DUF4149 domain-containing protein [Alicyclobacillus tolerans]MCF8565379.1 DUF4149 domain-containing protein [Alicyclobacillus tolerans]